MSTTGYHLRKKNIVPVIPLHFGTARFEWPSFLTSLKVLAAPSTSTPFHSFHVLLTTFVYEYCSLRSVSIAVVRFAHFKISLPCPLRSHRRSATQTPKKAFYHFRFAPMICIFLGVFAPQWRSVPLRSTQRRRKKEERKRRGKGISAIKKDPQKTSFRILSSLLTTLAPEKNKSYYRAYTRYNRYS